MSITKDYIKFNEGKRLKLYKCLSKKITTGYGRNLTDNGISEDEAELMLKNDLEVCKDVLYDIFGFENFLLLSDKRRMILTDMVYNLGESRFRTFKKMIHAVKNRDYYEAATQILDSNYATQVPNRAKRNAKLMEG